MMEQDREVPVQDEVKEEAGDKAGAEVEWAGIARARPATAFARSAEKSRSMWPRNRALRENVRDAERP